MVRKVLSPINSFVGNRIKEQRERLGKTQDEVAQNSKINPKINRTSLAFMEAGKQSIPVDRLYAIAFYLEIEVTQLLPTREDLKEDLKQNVIYENVQFDHSPSEYEDADFQTVAKLVTKKGRAK